MKLKTLELDGKVYAEVDDGKPIYLADDGKAIPFDAPHTVATIARLNGESKSQREAREAAEKRLRDFEGIEDPEAARSALETIRNLKDGDLIKAGEVEAIKAAAKKAADDQVVAAMKSSQAKIKDLEKDRDGLRKLYTDEKIGRVFNGSKFIAEKCNVPAPMMQAQFGGAFRIEDGRVVAYDGDNKVFSRTKPGDIADPDEALEILVDQYAYRDHILKSSGSSGAGARPGTNSNGRQQISRAEFDKLPPLQKRELALKHVQIFD